METIQKVDGFFQKFDTATFTKGQIILHPETPIRSVFYIKKGIVSMYTISSEGEEIILTIFRPHSYIPIMLILATTENRYYFKALENCELVKAPIQSVLDFLHKDSEVLFELTTRFAQAICGLLIRIEELTTASAGGKISNLLLYFAEKFGERHQGGIRITPVLTHEDIAHWIGTTRETVSRQLKKMQKQGVIKVLDKHIFIPDVDTFKKQVQMV